jgi:F420-dependent oxidoreductase-like protein
MRFSFWPTTNQPWSDILDASRYAEQTGWDGVWLADHFMPFAGDVDAPMHECLAGLAGLAASVPRVRIGSLVLGNTYRHPAVVAKQAVTIDHIAPGRLVLGVGAGWQENEHAAYGIELPPVKERLDRFEEACEVISSLLANERTTFSGTHYHLDDAPLSPKAATGHIPLLVGGGGERRTLKIAARYADEWNTWGLPDLLAQKGAVLDRHCEAIGRDPASIVRSANALVIVSDDEQRLARFRNRDLGRPTIVGTPDEAVEVIAAYRDAGVDELIVPDGSLGRDPSAKRAAMDLFMAEVAAKAR